MPWVKRDESIRSNYERLLDIKLNPEEEIDEEKYTLRLNYEKEIIYFYLHWSLFAAHEKR